MPLLKKIEKKFRELYGESPYLVRSPGRVNLLGEHTDYNMGYVLPAAIQKVIYHAISPRKDKRCKVFAIDKEEFCEFSVDDIRKSEKQWANYIIGVVDQLKKFGQKIVGFNCVFGGNIPIGAGLSSSAALETGLAYGINHINKLGLDSLTLVKIGQRAENEFVGVKCGIMDQYINIFGKRGHVVRIDCRNLERSYFPFEYENISIVLIDSKVSHSLAGSEYNRRRMECGEGVKVIKQDYPEVESLRDVSLEMIGEYISRLDPVIYRRCKYVVEENDRVKRGCEALELHDLRSFGGLMYQTHEGLRREYEVSCKELDYLVDLTKGNEYVYGSRMMGGGFGGCTINIIEKEGIGVLTGKIKEEYMKKFGAEADVYETSIGDGTSIIETKENVLEKF